MRGLQRGALHRGSNVESTIFRLDFSRRTVEEIDSRVPPRGVQEASAGGDVAARRSGYTLAALGTPPPDQDDADE